MSRQEVDDDEDDDRCATCVLLNLTRISTKTCLFKVIVADNNGDPYHADIIAFLRAPSDVRLVALSWSKRDHIQHYILDGDLLLYLIDQFYNPRTVIGNDMDMRARTHPRVP